MFLKLLETSGRWATSLQWALNMQSVNHITHFSSLLFSRRPIVLISIFCPIPFLDQSQEKRNVTVIFLYIWRYSLCMMEWGNRKKREIWEGGFELMYGWIKLSYPTPPPQGPFYSPSIAEIGFSSALCHSVPHRPPFGPINSRSRLNNKNHAMAAGFSVTRVAEGRY